MRYSRKNEVTEIRLRFHLRHEHFYGKDIRVCYCEYEQLPSLPSRFNPRKRATLPTQLEAVHAARIMWYGGK
jgi:hypothetical protein